MNGWPMGTAPKASRRPGRALHGYRWKLFRPMTFPVGFDSTLLLDRASPWAPFRGLDESLTPACKVSGPPMFISTAWDGRTRRER